jgi:hypothetical protein
MTQVAIMPEVLSAEVSYPQQTLATEAEMLLCEIRPLDRQDLSLETLRLYYQRLEYLVQELSKVKSFGRQVLPELRSRLHGFGITIQNRQNQPT